MIPYVGAETYSRYRRDVRNGTVQLSTAEDYKASVVIAMWKRGFDTWLISKHLSIAEPTVCRIVIAEREARR